MGKLPVAGTCTYAASKAYASNFAQGLGYEVESKIDVMDFVLGEVITKLKEADTINSRCVTPEVAVKGLLKDLGRERESWGCAKHERNQYFLSLAPIGAFNRMMYKNMSKVYNSTVDRMEKEGRNLDDYDKR